MPLSEKDILNLPIYKNVAPYSKMITKLKGSAIVFIAQPEFWIVWMLLAF